MFIFQIWNVNNFEVTHTLNNIHPKKTLMGGKEQGPIVTHIGVTNLLLSKDHVLSCGIDGTVKYTPFSGVVSGLNYFS